MVEVGTSAGISLKATQAPISVMFRLEGSGCCWVFLAYNVDRVTTPICSHVVREVVVSQTSHSPHLLGRPSGGGQHLALCGSSCLPLRGQQVRASVRGIFNALVFANMSDVQATCTLDILGPLQTTTFTTLQNRLHLYHISTIIVLQLQPAHRCSYSKARVVWGRHGWFGVALHVHPQGKPLQSFHSGHAHQET